MKKKKILTRKNFMASCGSALGLLLFGKNFGRFASAGPRVLPKTSAKKLPFTLQHTGTLKPEMSAPLGIAFGANDALCVAGEKGVMTYDAKGQAIRTFRTSSPALCAAMDEDGVLFAALGTRIEKFSPSGEILTAWGEEGEGKGRLRWITGMALWRNSLYVADSGNRKMLHFSVNGDFVEERTGFHIPSPYFDCGVDTKGTLVLAHTARHRIERYDGNGKLLGYWGEAGAAPEKFCGCCNPTNITVFGDGRVATSEKGMARLKVYDAQGRLLAHLDSDALAKMGVEVRARSARPAGKAALQCHDGEKGRDLATDSKGRLAMLDPRSATVHFLKLVPLA